MRQNMQLDEIIAAILQSMKDAGYNSGTVQIYRDKFSRLLELAASRKEAHYSPELGEAFIEDRSYCRSADYNHARYLYHCRCVQFIESYIKDGRVDWSTRKLRPQYLLAREELAAAKDSFESLMTSNGLKENTKDGYRRLVHYFLKYLEDKGYCSLSHICSGDVVAFIVLLCKEHYQPTSLGSHLPGLRMFLRMDEATKRFEAELPERTLRKKEIIGVYSDEEHDRIIRYLENSDISLRNRALSLLALETGLRAVDLCNLKLDDIDWPHNCMHIVQEKTGKAINIPMSASFGNAIADYLLTERPNSDSRFVFLSSVAPFSPMRSHTGCYKILFDAVTNAGVSANGRAFGTRTTRHSFASRLLRQGVPLPVISEALGHGNPGSVMIYLNTDDAKLAECTLPLPGKDGDRDDR